MTSDELRSDESEGAKTESNERLPEDIECGSDAESKLTPVSESEATTVEECTTNSIDMAPLSDAETSTPNDCSDVRPKSTPTKKRKRRRAKTDSAEQRLLGRQALCKSISDIVPHMLKTVKLRILGRHLDSTRGMDDQALSDRIVSDAKAFSDPQRIFDVIERVDQNVDRRNLKDIIIFTLLLEEETYSLDENRLAEKVVEYEQALVDESKNLSFFDEKKNDPVRCHHYDTYRIVLDAAWRNDGNVSRDEANLLKVLRERLHISSEEHRLVGASIGRFPKADCAIHTHDEIHDARKELQRDAIVWSYRDENNKNIDIIPSEIVRVIRAQIADLELQQVNYRRILEHDRIRVSDLRSLLKNNELDHAGNKAEIIERIIVSSIKPTSALDSMDKSRLADMCRLVGLKSSGNKAALVARLIEFYDGLTFEERETQDEREEWYNNYELLATRSYSDLRAKKLISKDLDVEHQFEKATDFLFESMLKLKIDNSRKSSQADGKLLLDNKELILWDCKSVEKAVNLQDHLESQFDHYLRKEREKGGSPLAFFIIGPSFTAQSIKLACQYKAKTNWDITLIEAGALKSLADQWDEMEPEKAFPIRLLNRTEVIDRDRIDFLLSLA